MDQVLALKNGCEKQLEKQMDMYVAFLREIRISNVLGLIEILCGWCYKYMV